MPNNLTTNTICALATPAGGAIGVVRVSGSEAIKIADHIFKAKSGRKLANAKGNTLHYGEIVNHNRETIDDVMASVYRAPFSYTGEDAVEFSCHGSQYILQEVLHLLIQNGCRQAEPGEYTQRAYLNGKMDLSQAEAVADLIASTNRATHKMAISQLKGHFSNELILLRDRLLKMTSLLELELDFSDHEELEFADRKQLLELACQIDEKITSLIQSFETGNALKNGIPVAIVGKTNVGKSTLLNRLLHEERAIVSDIHGTTRDTIEDTTLINGVAFRFIDTAGIRKTEDEVERIGIDRTYQKIDQATVVVWMIDTSPSALEQEDMKSKCIGKNVILVHNKVDIALTHSPSYPQECLHGFQERSHCIKEKKEAPSYSKKTQLYSKERPDSDNASGSSILYPSPTQLEWIYDEVFISAKQGFNISNLEAAIYKASNIPNISENDIIVTNARHYDALLHAKQDIIRVQDALHANLSGDLVSEELHICLDQLSEITGGQITPNEVLANIFKHFCVGK